jgi:hypothetical protein
MWSSQPRAFDLGVISFVPDRIYFFLVLSQRWIAFFKAASIFAPLLEKGRAENIPSAISSCVRSLPSDWTH